MNTKAKKQADCFDIPWILRRAAFEAPITGLRGLGLTVLVEEPAHDFDHAGRIGQDFDSAIPIQPGYRVARGRNPGRNRGAARPPGSPGYGAPGTIQCELADSRHVNYYWRAPFSTTELSSSGKPRRSATPQPQLAMSGQANEKPASAGPTGLSNCNVFASPWIRARDSQAGAYRLPVQGE